jgi:hypothetical protein
MKMTFYEKYKTGQINIDAIDDYTNEWHSDESNLKIHEFLGLTREQYANWVRYRTIE